MKSRQPADMPEPRPSLEKTLVFQVIAGSAGGCLFFYWRSRRLESSEKRILIVTNFGHMMSHYNMFVFPSLVLPLTASLNLDLAQTLALPFLAVSSLRSYRAPLGAGRRSRRRADIDDRYVPRGRYKRPGRGYVGRIRPGRSLWRSRASDFFREFIIPLGWVLFRKGSNDLRLQWDTMRFSEV